MPRNRVLRVLEEGGNRLLVADNGEIGAVGNRTRDPVSAGDYIEIQDLGGREVAKTVVRTDDPPANFGRIRKIVGAKILVETESGQVLLPKPNQPVSTDDGVWLTELQSLYRVVDSDLYDSTNRTSSVISHTSNSDPSNLRPDDVPDKEYDDFGGMDEIIEEVKYKVKLPLSEPERFERVGIEAPRGVLFYGPPGTGKTYLAKIVANQVEDASFYSIRGPELSHELVGGTERILRSLFDKAQSNPPAIIFFDEIDSMAPRRDKTMDAGRRTVGQLLSLMDGLESRGRVVVIGTTNLLDAIDPALRRPGRFGREIEFSRPSRKGREAILEIHRPEIDFEEGITMYSLAEQMDGWTGAHIKSFFEEVGEILLMGERDLESGMKIYQMDVERAIERVQAQINNKEAQRRRENKERRGENNGN